MVGCDMRPPELQNHPIMGFSRGQKICQQWSTCVYGSWQMDTTGSGGNATFGEWHFRLLCLAILRKQDR